MYAPASQGHPMHARCASRQSCHHISYRSYFLILLAFGGSAAPAAPAALLPCLTGFADWRLWILSLASRMPWTSAARRSTL
eukprot:4928132-Pyramimonas_sp.AAC.1